MAESASPYRQLFKCLFDCQEKADEVASAQEQEHKRICRQKHSAYARVLKAFIYGALGPLSLLAEA